MITVLINKDNFLLNLVFNSLIRKTCHDLAGFGNSQIVIIYAATTSRVGFISLLNNPSIAINVPEIEVGQLPQAPW